jgi:hypothetical protein
MESQLSDLRAALTAHEDQDRADFSAVREQLTSIQVSIAEQKPWVTLVAQLVVTALSVGLGYWLGHR